MALADDRAIERLASRFLERTLPKVEWTHEGHFAAALWLLRHRPALAVPQEIRVLITGYNVAAGTANTDKAGYHHTITLASLGAASRVLSDHEPDAPLHDVLRSLMASPIGRPDWLLAYWRRETLFSVAARKAWVAPDLAALPF